MRVVYVGDIHLRQNAPSRRTDDVLETVLGKLSWIAEYANNIEAEAVLLGGDVGHHFDWKISMVSRVEKVLRQFNMPIYSVIGNHDVPGKDIGRLDDTGLGDLIKRRCIRLLNPVKPTVIGNWLVFGFHSDTHETTQLLSGNWITKIPEKYKDYKIVGIVHAPISNTATPYSIDHKTLFIPDFHLLLFADIHDGFKPYNSLAGPILANSGVIFRQKIDERFIEPKFLVIDENLKIEEVVIPHRKIEEVFNLSGLVSSDKPLGTKFTEAIAEAVKSKDLKPEEVIDIVAEELGYPSEVSERLKEML